MEGGDYGEETLMHWVDSFCMIFAFGQYILDEVQCMAAQGKRHPDTWKHYAFFIGAAFVATKVWG